MPRWAIVLYVLVMVITIVAVDMAWLRGHLLLRLVVNVAIVAAFLLVYVLALGH